MTFISLIDLRKQNRGKLPMDCIIYRTRAKKDKSEKVIIEILIPRQISIKVGIDNGTQVDILYNPKPKIIKLRLLTKTGGFNVSLCKNNNPRNNEIPAKRVKIQTTWSKESHLPLTNSKNIFIKQFDISDGLNFSLDSASE